MSTLDYDLERRIREFKSKVFRKASTRKERELLNPEKNILAREQVMALFKTGLRELGNGTHYFFLTEPFVIGIRDPGRWFFHHSYKCRPGVQLDIEKHDQEYYALEIGRSSHEESGIHGRLVFPINNVFVYETKKESPYWAPAIEFVLTKRMGSIRRRWHESHAYNKKMPHAYMIFEEPESSQPIIASSS